MYVCMYPSLKLLIFCRNLRRLQPKGLTGPIKPVENERFELLLEPSLNITATFVLQ